MDHEQAKVLALPISVVGRVDLGRLIREVELLDEFLHQAAAWYIAQTPTYEPSDGRGNSIKSNQCAC
jgi:hypothetical protein